MSNLNNAETIANILSAQHATLVRWQANLQRDAQVLTTEIIQRFRRKTQQAVTEFMWGEQSFIDAIALQASGLLGEVYGEILEAHFARSFQPIEAELTPHLGNAAPDIARTQIDVVRCSMVFMGDVVPFQRAIKSIEPGILASLLAPSMENDDWDAYSQVEGQKAVQALCVAVEKMEQELTASIAKSLADALDEYQHQLDKISYTRPIANTEKEALVVQ